MPASERRRVALVGFGCVLVLAVLLGSLVLAHENRGKSSDALPDFAIQKVVYEASIGTHYTFSGTDAVLLRPDDLGAGWYFGNDPAAKQTAGSTSAQGSAERTKSSRRLVKATRAAGTPWKAETCVMETVIRGATPAAAAGNFENLVHLIDGKGLKRVVGGIPVTVLDTPQMRSAVFQRGLDVFNLNVCLHLATSDFSPTAADAVLEAAVHRSAN